MNTVIWTMIGCAFATTAALGGSMPPPGREAQNTPRPRRDFFHVPAMSLAGHDAPMITNNRLWAQAAARAGRSGLLNMEDVWAGRERMTNRNTLLVRVNNRELSPEPTVADWWPNCVRRRATVEGITYQGSVKTPRHKMALLSELAVVNTGTTAQRVHLEFEFGQASGLFGMVEKPDTVTRSGERSVYQFKDMTLPPGQTVRFHALNLYRDTEATRDLMLQEFSHHWHSGGAYWETLLEDAFTPGPGPYLAGGVPEFHTKRADVQRFYNFGVLTALMLMNRDDDRDADSNLYLVAMPDDNYCTAIYMWDGGYASELLAQLDPAALRRMIEMWLTVGIYKSMYANYDNANRPGWSWYAASLSLVVRAVENYVGATGDEAFLDRRVADRTVLEHLIAATEWAEQRRQWNGLFDAGEEKNLFDDNPSTVAGYSHYVAAPNAADVFARRTVADLLAARHQHPELVFRLRAQADSRAKAILRALYNGQGEYAGTWKQRHADGTILKIRHGWDFMNTGSFLARDLSSEQKQQMRDWFVNHIARFGTDDVWVVAQDPRDGNNGPNQMEHNGMGAYAAWPYHYGWALHAMGFHEDAARLLETLDGITAWGPIGQGHHRDGRRCRSNWVSAAGATAAAYVINLLFDAHPGLGPFEPRPQLRDFGPDARLIGLRVQGRPRTVASREVTSGN